LILLQKLDGLLDRLTMYKLLLYFLIALLAIAIGFGAIGKIPYSPLDIAGSAFYIVIACWITNQVFSRFLKIPSNVDSTYITALILALIIPPNFSQDGILFMTAASGLAIASKYLLTLDNKHIFNPAAIAVVLTAFGPHQTATWWVGNPMMMPFVLIGGFLLMRRIRRSEMVEIFLGVALISMTVYTIVSHGNVTSMLHNTIFSSALLFMAFVMLTEPLTSPSTKRHEIWYSVLTGLLFFPRVHIGTIYSTPELVLCVGNIFAFIVNPQDKIFPTLVRKLKITPDTLDFVFMPERHLNFKPGQYMEFTLPHARTDLRGQRRYFTLASSPTEEHLRIGVKFYPGGSSFKKALLHMDEQTPFVAASLGGDFVLPNDLNRKIVLIAGGIGVTPFRSMIKYMIDTNEARPLTLLYSAATANDVAYRDVFEQARSQLGIKVYYNLTQKGTHLPNNYFRPGMITPEFIHAVVPDYLDSTFYISGPHAMVVAIEKALNRSGIHQRHIKTDFFSGYA
jgi:ferredoxin-NADP reductase/Na+-translocating ferredoxin:NAD+ oxidoreductase RnfD subunit